MHLFSITTLFFCFFAAQWQNNGVVNAYENQTILIKPSIFDEDVFQPIENKVSLLPNIAEAHPDLGYSEKFLTAIMIGLTDTQRRYYWLSFSGASAFTNDQYASRYLQVFKNGVPNCSLAKQDKISKNLKRLSNIMRFGSFQYEQMSVFKNSITFPGPPANKTAPFNSARKTCEIRYNPCESVTDQLKIKLCQVMLQFMLSDDNFEVHPLRGQIAELGLSSLGMTVRQAYYFEYAFQARIFPKEFYKRKDLKSPLSSLGNFVNVMLKQDCPKYAADVLASRELPVPFNASAIEKCGSIFNQWFEYLATKNLPEKLAFTVIDLVLFFGSFDVIGKVAARKIKELDACNLKNRDVWKQSTIMFHTGDFDNESRSDTFFRQVLPEICAGVQNPSKMTPSTKNSLSQIKVWKLIYDASRNCDEIVKTTASSVYFGDSKFYEPLVDRSS